MVSQFPLNLSGIVSVWFETLLYGMYCSLFFEACYVILKKRRVHSVPNKVYRLNTRWVESVSNGMNRTTIGFFGSALAMFAIATAHIAINLYRLLRGYVWLADDPGPAAYFGDLTRWDNIAHDALNAVMTWIGDSLVIYRCYLVWDQKIYIVILPIILLIISIIANSVALHTFAHLELGTIFSASLVHWMSTIYAIAFVQNTMTTGLLAWRIWRANRASQQLATNGKRQATLVPVIRIVVESAMIYDMEVLVLIVLYALGHNGQYVAQEAIVPTVGIVFTLITVRVAMRSSPQLATTLRPSGIDGVGEETLKFASSNTNSFSQNGLVSTRGDMEKGQVSRLETDSTGSSFVPAVATFDVEEVNSTDD